MLRYAALLCVLAAGSGCMNPYVQREQSAAAGGTAPAPYQVRVNPDGGGPTETLPTDYPDFRPGDRVRILASGKVVPM